MVSNYIYALGGEVKKNIVNRQLIPKFIVQNVGDYIGYGKETNQLVRIFSLGNLLFSSLSEINNSPLLKEETSISQIFSLEGLKLIQNINKVATAASLCAEIITGPTAPVLFALGTNLTITGVTGIIQGVCQFKQNYDHPYAHEESSKSVVSNIGLIVMSLFNLKKGQDKFIQSREIENSDLSYYKVKINKNDTFGLDVAQETEKEILKHPQLIKKIFSWKNSDGNTLFPTIKDFAFNKYVNFYQLETFNCLNREVPCTQNEAIEKLITEFDTYQAVFKSHSNEEVNIAFWIEENIKNVKENISLEKQAEGVIFLPTSDYNGAFRKGGVMEQNLLKVFKLQGKKIRSIHQICETMNQIVASSGNKLKVVVLGGHGNAKFLRLSATNILSILNINEVKDCIQNNLHERGTIIVNSCSTGSKYEDLPGLAESIALNTTRQTGAPLQDIDGDECDVVINANNEISSFNCERRDSSLGGFMGQYGKIFKPLKFAPEPMESSPNKTLTSNATSHLASVLTVENLRLFPESIS